MAHGITLPPQYSWTGYSSGLTPVPTQKFRPKAPKKTEVKPPPMPISSADLTEQLSHLLIGQDKAIEAIIPYILAHTAGLASPTRPAGCMLLLGPTGSGKTCTVEALANVLHGDEKKLIRVDCGSLVLQHEVAKLIGAPPGYLGHRETQPMITQKRLDGVASEACPLSIVLFDEIEKAHASVFQMLLSITDKGTLSLGDNTSVNFRNALIFFTSNLGAREMQQSMTPELGFSPAPGGAYGKMERIGMVAVKKRFTPEFINRLDEIITYTVLSKPAINAIFTLAVDKVRNNIFAKYGASSFLLVFSEEATELLISEGFSEKYGARELSRVIFRKVIKPLSNYLIEHTIAPGAVVRIHLNSNKEITLDVMDQEMIKKLAKAK